MSEVSGDYLFGVISMTPALWKYLAGETILTVSALSLCTVPLRTSLVFRRLKTAGKTVLVLSLLLSATAYFLSLLASFGVSSNIPPSEKAAKLATEILTMMHVRWMWIPFAMVIGVLLMIQDRRSRRLESSS